MADELLEEISRLKIRASKAGYIDAKRELADNLYPLLEMLAERFVDAEAVCMSFLPDLAERVEASLEIGRRLCAALEPHLANLPDEVKNLVGGYIAASVVAEDALNELLDEEDDDEPDDMDEGEDDDFANDSDDEDEGEEDIEEVDAATPEEK